MRSLATYVVFSTLRLMVDAAPHSTSAWARQLAGGTSPANTPQNDSDPEGRAAGVSERRAGFGYGRSLIGEAAPFPNGTLGDNRTAYDYSVWEVDRNQIDAAVAKDVEATTAAIQANGGLKTFDDYVSVLYGGTWKNSNPLGETQGIMTNFTQDLLFSMERLSQNTYPLELVKPSGPLPFEIPEDLAPQIAGVSLDELHQSGSLFVVDHRYQSELEKTTIQPQRYGAASSAYFYIHPESGDFLPLAIRTNAGSDLVYSPLDDPTDWLLAKMIFNVNDFFHAQMFHLVVTHDVSEAVHLAALRTLSEKHPVMIILERLMLQGYSSRVVGEELCFNPGGHWDQLFYVNNIGCRDYVTNNWPTRGAYQGGYLKNDFQARGLVDENSEFNFKFFPFYQDALKIQEIYREFFVAFVDSYYASDDDVAADSELQNWFAEAPAAKVVDFPTGPVTKETLTDVLTHFGFIVSVVHHGLNGGDPVGSKATLPFHLNAMYAPLPTEKGVTDLLPFLPPAEQAVHYIAFIATFNRPFYRTSGRTLEYAFWDESLLERFNKETRAAAADFRARMNGLSREIRTRDFDEKGLSLGMPFIYRTLDPGYIPYFSAV
ncbi:hypothetical protein DL768_003952 [Monosporascus sp. mg162]|nr:hypothetical protein DL768_003952 [Monosporascus sp. mg162]